MMAEGTVSSRYDALKTLSEQQMPRDFYLSLQDIASISQAEDRNTWRLAEIPQESVLLWADQNPDKVLYMHEQQPLEGTRDCELIASMRQQAAQRASMHTESGQREKSGSPGKNKGDDCLVKPAFAGADELDSTGDGAAGGGIERGCGDTVITPRQLPEL